MLKVFNTTALTQKQRFTRAVLFGLLTSIGLTFAYVIVNKLMFGIGFVFDIFYVGIGYVIGLVIQKTGHGVQAKFSILAAVFCVMIIIFGDLFTLYPLLLKEPSLIGNAFVWLIQYYFSGVFSIIGFAFRIYGVYTAYQTARIV